MPSEHAIELPLGTKPTILLIGTAVHLQSAVFRTRLPPQMWWLHIVQYRGAVTIDGRKFEIRPGFVTLVPPLSAVEWEFGHNPVHRVCHFKMDLPLTVTRTVPVVQDLKDGFVEFSNHFDRVVVYSETDRTRAEVSFWELLFSYAEMSEIPADLLPDYPSPLRWAMLLVEERMGDPLTAVVLAGYANVSATHLNRLFHSHHGMSCMQYLRHRRIQRARDLLVRSSLPVMTIAEQVGIPNLQHFNKIIRHSLGASPRAVRSDGQRAHPPYT